MNGKHISWQAAGTSGARSADRHDDSHREHHEPVGLYFVVALICGALAFVLPSRG